MHDTDRYLERPDVKEAGFLMLVPIVVFGIANVILGIHPQPVVEFIRRIAEGIL